jgi:hypothetical protein
MMLIRKEFEEFKEFEELQEFEEREPESRKCWVRGTSMGDPPKQSQKNNQ